MSGRDRPSKKGCLEWDAVGVWEDGVRMYYLFLSTGDCFNLQGTNCHVQKIPEFMASEKRVAVDYI